MNGKMPDWDEYKHLTEDQKEYWNFKRLESIHTNAIQCESRISRLEKRKHRDTAMSTGAGFVGGAVAMIGLKLKEFIGG